MKLGERCDAIIRLIERALDDKHVAGEQVTEAEAHARGRRPPQSVAAARVGRELEDSR